MSVGKCSQLPAGLPTCPRGGGVLGGGAGATEEPGVGARSYRDEAPFAAKPCPRISPSAPPSVTSLEAGLQRGKCIQVRSRRGRGALVPREGPCERSGTRPGAGPWWGPALPAPDPMAPTPAWKSTSPVSEPPALGGFVRAAPGPSRSPPPMSRGGRHSLVLRADKLVLETPGRPQVHGHPPLSGRRLSREPGLSARAASLDGGISHGPGNSLRFSQHRGPGSRSKAREVRAATSRPARPRGGFTPWET